MSGERHLIVATVALAVATAGVLASASIAWADGDGPSDPGRLNPIELGGYFGSALFDRAPDATRVAPQAGPAFGVRGGYRFNAVVGVEAEVDGAPTEARGSGDDAILVLGARVHGVAFVPSQRLARNALYPFFSAGAGVTTSSYTPSSSTIGSEEVRVPLMSSDVDVTFDIGLGLKWMPERRLGLRLDTRFFSAVSSDDFLSQRYQISLGAFARFGAPGSAAPKEEQHVPGPAEVTDDDSDGVLGEADTCPTEAEDADNYEDEDGCPDIDNDSDGISDDSDLCPLEAENINDIDDADGCIDQDVDGDGLLGSADQCPAEAEDPDDFTDEDGCPDPDNDQDAILDGDDKCPDTLETLNGFDDGDGCVDKLPKKLAKLGGVQKAIKFKGKTAQLPKGTTKALDKLAKALAAYPTATFEISVHTKASKDHEADVALSQKRAAVVKEYLLVRKVDPTRMSAVGVGPDRPQKVRGKEKAVERVELTFGPVVPSEEPAPVAEEPAPVAEEPAPVAEDPPSE